MFINAKMDKAYTTGIYIDVATAETHKMRPDGTWMTEVGFVFAAEDEETHEMRSMTLELLFSPPKGFSNEELAAHRSLVSNGYVLVDGKLMDTSIVNLKSAGAIRLKESNSGTTVEVSILGVFEAEFSLVPPPEEWDIPKEEQAQYSHINLKLHQIALSPLAHGVLGSTQHLQFVDGEPVLEGHDKDGQGVLEGTAGDYEVPSLLSSKFTYSVTEDSALTGKSYIA